MEDRGGASTFWHDSRDGDVMVDLQMIRTDNKLRAANTRADSANVTLHFSYPFIHMGKWD